MLSSDNSKGLEEAGGTYRYFGIYSVMQGLPQRLWSVVPNRQTFRLQLNVDGLPLFKSSSLQFWPILGMLQEHCKKPFVIALYCEKSKA